MYTAKVITPTTATSLRVLVNTAVTGEIPDTFNGRCFQVTLIPTAGTFISSRGGTTLGNNPVALVANVITTFQSPTGNQISVDEIFLSGTAGTETVGVIILVL